jgi:tRNA threonylcarbamoyladenosine biosynthesis protein TsaE
METMDVITESSAGTRRIGRLLGEILEPGDVLFLTGPLGAGKTTLTQGIARGLGISAEVMSPTFVLMRELKGRLALYHIDLYRLDDLSEIADLGLDDYFYGDGVTVVEWADRAEALLPEERLAIVIDYQGEQSRSLKLSARGERYLDLLHRFARRWGTS